MTRDEAKEKIINDFCKCRVWCELYPDMCQMESCEIWWALKALPSAQPEIIRCKDCKHFAGEGMYCGQDICVQFDHFYCYYGELSMFD